MIAAILLALYEQSKAQPNVYIMTGAVVVFMYGLMRFSAKVKSKSADDDNI